MSWLHWIQMLATSMRLTFSFLLLLSGLLQCQFNEGFDPLGELIKAQRKEWHVHYSSATSEADSSTVYIGSQDGLKEADKIEMLPGQPSGVIIHQYSGYVTVDPKAGRELFYYFVESHSPLSKPLVLWLNGGPGCSSFGYGAMMELGPFRVNSDGKTLSNNGYAWNNVANMLFLDSPVGVGFSYSNTSSDYDLNGDKRAADDAHTFLVNWFERFPEYKNREFFIAGESYAGHYVPQLALKIIQFNKILGQPSINLKGIALGNAWIDTETGNKGMYDFFWTHALISDEVNAGINFNCNFTSSMNLSDNCTSYLSQADDSMGDIYIYDIYAPSCSSVSNSTKVAFDPCSEQYIKTYLNTPEVQKSLHANVTGIPGPWQACNYTIPYKWKDKPPTVLPIIEVLMTSGINVYIYSGDTDGRVPTTSTRYSINKLGASVRTPWYPWYTEGEVGGYAVGYDQNLKFVTIRGAGHFVPSYQPARALALFSSFLAGKLPSPH